MSKHGHGCCRFCGREFSLYADGSVWRHLCAPEHPCSGTRRAPGRAPKPGQRVTITTGYDAGPLFGFVDGQVRHGIFVGMIPGIIGRFFVATEAPGLPGRELVDITHGSWRVM